MTPIMMSFSRRFLAPLSPRLAVALCGLAGCADASAPAHLAATLEGPGIDRTPAEGACEDAASADGDDPFADCVDRFQPAGDASFGHEQMPDIVLGSPAGGMPGGTMDVASLGCGGQLTLFFDSPGIENGPGPDLGVFENPFVVGEQSFAEPARVLVSEDGEDWRAYPCDLDGEESWPPAGCAGVTPVAANADNGLSVDPDSGGGDWFDLEDVGLEHARYVRLVDVSVDYFGAETWCSGDPAGFDLDAVVAVPR